MIVLKWSDKCWFFGEICRSIAGYNRPDSFCHALFYMKLYLLCNGKSLICFYLLCCLQ